jgi:fructokinase
MVPIKGARVVDTAGAGDWCTAGLLAHIGTGGAVGFDEVTRDEIRAALHYGQALSAWNCEFEGARGGMYERTPREFASAIEAIVNGAADPTVTAVEAEAHDALDDLCPSCPGPKKAAKAARTQARTARL